MFERLESTLRDAERVVFALGDREGVLERNHDGRTDRFEPADDQPVVAAVTGCRLVARVPRSGRGNRERFPIHFSDVERIGVDDPERPTTLSLRGAGGVRWQVPVGGADADTVGEVAAYVRTGADCYGRAQAAAELVRERRDAVLSGDDAVYDSLTERLDRVRERASGTPFADESAFTETLRGAERALERARAAALLVRVDEASAAWLADDRPVTARREVYGTLADWYVAARDRIDAGIDPFDEPGLFDGTGPAGDVTRPSPLDAVDGDAAVALAAARVRTVADRLLDTGDTRLEAAGATDDAEERLEHLAAARACYRAVLYGSWGSPALLPGEREQVAHRRERAVAAVIEARREAADRLALDGHAAVDEGRTGTAVGAFDEALEHLETAHALASEFRAGEPSAVADQWAAVQETRPADIAGVALRDAG